MSLPLYSELLKEKDWAFFISASMGHSIAAAQKNVKGRKEEGKEKKGREARDKGKKGGRNGGRMEGREGGRKLDLCCLVTGSPPWQPGPGT